MKVRRNFYTSYETHNYCNTCEEWILKTDNDGKYCTVCKYKLRKKPRYSHNKEVHRY